MGICSSPSEPPPPTPCSHFLSVQKLSAHRDGLPVVLQRSRDTIVVLVLLAIVALVLLVPVLAAALLSFGSGLVQSCCRRCLRALC